MEYSIRIEQWKVCEPISEEMICSPQTLYDIMREKFNPFQEEMHILAVNSQNKVLDCFLIAKGKHNSLNVTPREVLLPVIQTGACSFFMAHNHPSGNVMPSEEDLVFTKKIKRGAELLGISLLDHLVYSDKENFSFRHNAIL